MDKSGAQSPARLRFLVFGAGAIGSYIGGSLALQDQQVVFLEKPEMADRLAAHGLRLMIAGMDKSILHPLLAGSLPEALSSRPIRCSHFRAEIIRYPGSPAGNATPCQPAASSAVPPKRG